MSASVPEAAVCVHGRGVSSAHDGFKLLPFPLKGLHKFLYGLARDGNLPGALSVRACGHEVAFGTLTCTTCLTRPWQTLRATLQHDQPQRQSSCAEKAVWSHAIAVRRCARRCGAYSQWTSVATW